ncbi:transglutaminase domain-containing protein [Chitinophaga eiseniae]|uniref:Transglutaminase domain-containing protein n=1 Tax=Chitinophaga eiseniae TaxID=634771 RepID=A0A847SSJ7_9BACT|nr:transglutaminase domain-containing protein [Chitinophaga eiseniae]NLR80379.1 transglutaminase domain-containing protein [Chitinophaga eiseniae]
MKKRLLYILLPIFFYACGPREDAGAVKLKPALDYAGINAAELMKVITHYSQSPGDSLKLAAAIFLVENMPGKGTMRYAPITNCGLFKGELFTGDTIGIDSVNKIKRRIEDSLQCGPIKFVNPIFLADSRTISASLLMEDIEYAFKAWQLPWAKSLTFDEFREFILPHRVQNEPLQHWRKWCWEHSEWIFKKAGGSTDRVKIAGVVNDSLGKFYGYIHDAINYFPGTFTMDQLRVTRGGRCEDLNMIVGYWLRAIGIPMSTEFTFYWANGNFGGHSWLAVLDTTGKFVPMNAIYDKPVRDSLLFQNMRLAKAYRYSYRIDGHIILNEGQNFQSYHDITPEYVPTIDYAMKVPDGQHDKIFLGVLNGKYWKPLQIKTNRNGDSIIFKDIANTALYAPIIVLDGKEENTRTVGPPFLVTEGGYIQYFRENKDSLIDFVLDIAKLPPARYNKKCQVVYWDNTRKDWVPAGIIQTLKDDPDKLKKQKIKKMIVFSGVPANGIYRVLNAEIKQHDKSYGRPYVYNEEMKAFHNY